MRIMTTGGLFTILTIAVVIILGQAGQLSFGHSAFYGIGAYTAAILTMKAEFPTLAALVIGALVAGMIALIVGRPVLKLRYFYLALATIGLGQIFLVLVQQLRSVTGSTDGLGPRPVRSTSSDSTSTPTSASTTWCGWWPPSSSCSSTGPSSIGRAGRCGPSPPARSPLRAWECVRPTGSSWPSWPAPSSAAWPAASMPSSPWPSPPAPSPSPPPSCPSS